MSYESTKTIDVDHDAALRTFETVEDFVRTMGGRKAIKKVLVANNGIAAVKLITSVRKFSYNTFRQERAIQFVAMATPEDLRANAEFIRMADQVVEVPGGSNNNNYANVSLICDLAERYNVDAVWAGWGHASENPKLPRTLHKRGKVVFIGPPAAPMHALGDKIGSTIIAQSAGVPTIPWNGSDIDFKYTVEKGIPDDVYQKANVTTADEAAAAAARVGYPVMVKASEGGGGKGIRKVTDPKDLKAAFRQVQGEIPGSPIFVMKLAPRARHLEVQLLADAYGNAISLSGRDCSVQRRHQKIIEEGPPLAPTPKVWRRMEEAAVRLAKAVGYVNAGTVEYLYMESGEFAFLELNPRLQVEHPVTEMITGVNLPAAQLLVAMGFRLDAIPDVRRLYGLPAFGKSRIDNFSATTQKSPSCHVIAARITAENPDAGFQPTSGAIRELNFRSTNDVWGYFSIDSSGRVHEFADSQIGHLFAKGATREQARRHLVRALREFSIRGDIHTTVEYLVHLMESPDFVKNKINTAWLDQRIARNVRSKKPNALLTVVAAAAVRAFDGFSERVNDFSKFCERGQLPPRALLRVEEPSKLIYEDIKYELVTACTGPEAFEVRCNGSTACVKVRPLSDGGRLVLLGDKSHVAYGFQESSGSYRLVLNGATCLFTKEYDPTQIRSEMAGKLARLLVENGSRVKAGEPFVELEVMKMYLSLKAPENGVITFERSEGSKLEPGDLIARLVLDDPSKVKRAESFKGSLPNFDSSLSSSNESKIADRPHLRLRTSLKTLTSAMDGFAVSEDTMRHAVEELRDSANDPLLPVVELEEALSNLSGRLPSELSKALQKLAAEFRSAVESADTASDARAERERLAAVSVLFQVHTAELTPREATNVRTAASTLIELPQRFGVSSSSSSSAGRLVQEAVALLREFVRCERLHGDASMRADERFNLLREKHKISSEELYTLALAHAASPRRMSLVGMLMKVLLPDNTKLSASAAEVVCPILRELASLKVLTGIALEARQILLRQKLPTYSEQLRTVEQCLRDKRFDVLIDSNFDESTPLLDLASSEDAEVQTASLEAYVRCIYRPYDLISFEALRRAPGSPPVLIFKFKSPSNDADALVLNGMPAIDSFERFGGHLASQSGSPIKNVRNAQRKRAHPTESSRPPAESFDDDGSGSPIVRVGAIAMVRSVSELEGKDFTRLLELLSSQSTVSSGLSVNAVHLVLPARAFEEQSSKIGSKTVSIDERVVANNIRGALRSVTEDLKEASVRRVTCAIVSSPRRPLILSFPQRLKFGEDPILRHIEPSLAFHLQLDRLRNFSIIARPAAVIGGSSTSFGSAVVHVYEASPKAQATKFGGESSSSKRATVAAKSRFFVRALIRKMDRVDVNSSLDAFPDVEHAFVEALNALEGPMSEMRSDCGSNHIFLHALPEVQVETDFVVRVVHELYTRYRKRLKLMRVSMCELRVRIVSPTTKKPIAMRVVMSDPTGYNLKVETYAEVKDPSSGQLIFAAINEEARDSELDGSSVAAPHPIQLPMERKREQARRMTGTVYCYDLPQLFQHALRQRWKRQASDDMPTIPRRVVDAQELIFDESKRALCPAHRPACKNTIGMVGWRVKLWTPEMTTLNGDPSPREIFLVANDITHKAGTFGTKEDDLYNAVSEEARKEGLPFIYIAANSGARIGMAQELKSALRVSWRNASDPSKGFDYIWLTPEDYATHKDSVRAELRKVGSEERMVITAVIGKDHGIGVENLRGSGMIAGETARAYQDTFTLSYISGRCVGIGAYLVRLGQRTIQKTRGAPIILTGHNALNKLMGADVYTSNAQLGGVDIMHSNGVSHLTCDNDLDGADKILEWLSFVPAVRGGPLPIRQISVSGVGHDVIERAIDFQPTKEAYDPRWMLGGRDMSAFDSVGGESSSSKVQTGAKTFLTGFFDRGSWVESLAGWAKTVIVGRARLGGIPMGAIVSECRTVQTTHPADPAAPETGEVVITQPGQVWFPDSAYKTAQAIDDFNREGLPLIIFANWRGFSGGQRDMFDEVLKYGAFIVDALVDYRQPVFVYIPPCAELRGGSWVVVDPTINADMMEMYAAPTARGGILEPSGAVSIKFRDSELRKMALRVDDKLIALQRDLDAAVKKSSTNATVEAAEIVASLRRRVEDRVRSLIPVYRQIAEHFADLHDKPERMKAKGVIRGVVEWSSARKHFYWRLRRRLKEIAAIKQLREADPSLSFKDASNTLRASFCGRDPSRPAVWESKDRVVLMWLTEQRALVKRKCRELQKRRFQREISAMGHKDSGAVVSGVLKLIRELPAAQRAEAVAQLRRGVIFS